MRLTPWHRAAERVSGPSVRAQVREEAEAVAAQCGADIRVSSLAGESAAVQRDSFLHIGQLVVSTPGQVAQVTGHASHHPCMLPEPTCAVSASMSH